MDNWDLVNIIESLIFAADSVVPEDKLVKVVQEYERRTNGRRRASGNPAAVQEVIGRMNRRYESLSL